MRPPPPPTLDEALRALYATHDLPPDGGAHEPWFHVRIGPVSIPLPNPPARREAVFVHDTNHVLTGYDATFSDGEMRIAAFEVGASCGRVWVAWLLNLPLMALGAIMRPRRVFRAFVRGRRSVSLYTGGLGREALRKMTVSDLRALVRLDEDAGPARPREALGYAGWVSATWLMLLGGAGIVTMLVLALVRRWA